MCRIAGILQPGLEIDVAERRVKAMCRLLQHGGPDDEGIYSDAESGLVLGNRRLALLDLTPAGHMPMHFADRFVITYNGEVYNYLELKKELEALGHRFQNYTDTEVILAAFAQWREQSFARLQGMYAFAIWDKAVKELYLVRDAAGIKPVYYTAREGRFVFASEMRAFSASGEDLSANPQWKVMLMAWGHLPEPVTTLVGVQPLPKGCFLHYRADSGRLQIQSYRHYSYSERTTDPVVARQQVQELLGGAVQRQLLADAPVGVFLSGGLDSGIIASLAAQNSPEAIKTLSIYFDDARFSEKKYQDLLIQQLRCKHRQHLLTEGQFAAAFPHVLAAMDLPSSDGINTWFISKYAREQGLKAVLSGIGGDELFGGYPSFKRMQLASRLQQVPDVLVRQGKYSGSRKLSRLAYLQLPGIRGLYLFLRGHFSPYEIARHLEMDEAEVWQVIRHAPLLAELDLPAGNKASWMEFHLYMQNQLLRDADAMSMQHGVEIRVPFLDEGLVRTAFAMHPAAKYREPLPKQILIDCFKDILPEPVWNRPKMGFSFPFDEWFGQNELVKDTLGSSRHKESYRRFQEGDLRWYQAMLLLLLEQKEPAFA